MQITTTVRSLALIGVMSLFGGLAFADSGAGMLEDATTKADEAAEAAMKDAEAVAEKAVMKDEATEKQGAEFNAEEVGGVQGAASD